MFCEGTAAGYTPPAPDGATPAALCESGTRHTFTPAAHPAQSPMDGNYWIAGNGRQGVYYSDAGFPGSRVVQTQPSLDTVYPFYVTREAAVGVYFQEPVLHDPHCDSR